MFVSVPNSEFANSNLLVALAGSEEALKSYMAARDRLAIQQYMKEEAERKKREEEAEARARDPVNRAYRCVIEALKIGQSVKCPGCGNATRKDDACMHMDCDCGVHFCYVCGADRYPGVVGKGPDYHARNKVNCGCDANSSYLENQLGWSTFGVADRNETPADGALIEFHRRRMSFFVGVVKRVTGDAVWSQLRAAHAEVLHDLIEGRSISWEEVDAAEHPRFGTRTELPLVGAEEEQFRRDCVAIPLGF